VYVDDIVVKSDSFDQHVEDLKEVFKALRALIRSSTPKRAYSRLREGSSWV